MTSKRRQKPARRRRAQKKSISSNGLVLNEFVPSSPIRAAFWARATTALKRIAERADETSLERAVAAPTDAGTLARAMSDYPGIGDSVEELDPLAAAIARGAEQKVEILRQGGGALPVSDVAKLLGISRQAVDKRRREGKLLAVPRGADYVYPACLFADGEIVPGLTEILAQFGPQRSWTVLAFLVTPDDRLGALSPLEALQKKEAKLMERTLRLARAAAGDGFS
jgi:DNA-directed RNA polymerase specialized sigma24 family protein